MYHSASQMFITSYSYLINRVGFCSFLYGIKNNKEVLCVGIRSDQIGRQAAAWHCLQLQLLQWLLSPACWPTGESESQTENEREPLCFCRSARFWVWTQRSMQSICGRFVELLYWSDVAAEVTLLHWISSGVWRSSTRGLGPLHTSDHIQYNSMNSSVKLLNCKAVMQTVRCGVSEIKKKKSCDYQCFIIMLK